MNPRLHIAIIVDGNRRYAKKKNLLPWKGHEAGADKLKEFIEWSKELGVKELTLYTFSLKNFKRSKIEVNGLFDIFRKYFKEMKEDERIHKDKIKIRFIGRIDMFPEDIRDQMQELMDMTKDYNNYVVNFCMAYDGRAEIVDAVKKISNKVKSGELIVGDIDEEEFANALYMSDEPDIVIRTSGEQRISGFLLWQLSYAEFFFLKKLWPDIEKEDLKQIIDDFNKRERRFGS